MARKRKQLPETPEPASIESLSHDGRGIARRDGKTTFIDNALPGEEVMFKFTYMRRKFDEGKAVEIVTASPDRVEPPCQHSNLCGGCSLQHMNPDVQLARKEAVLREQLQHFGGLEPKEWLAPLTGPVTGYRSKARMGVKYVEAKGETLVGFREKRNSFIAQLQQCEVLIPSVGHRLSDLRTLMHGLKSRSRIPQIELAAGDEDVALIIRHLDPLPDEDQQAFLDFCQPLGWHLYLQPGNESTVHRIWPALTGAENEERLHYRHPSADVELAFHPTDFTQVNAEINRKMVPLALDLLDISPEDTVLDLFCGLGNFTIPAAKRASKVVGVEVSRVMVERGYENARRNGLDNLEFHAWDLSQDVAGQSWANRKYDRILIDPPRTGALEMVKLMPRFGAKRIVYVSCNPATLARDAGELTALGYRLKAAGVMDMFPHTTHVESIAVFEKK